jgi:hypothetical protein
MTKVLLNTSTYALCFNKSVCPKIPSFDIGKFLTFKGYTFFEFLGNALKSASGVVQTTIDL